MSKHTPGPWTINLVSRKSIMLIDAECLRITVDHSEDFGDAKEDAYLIAAAPDLLRVCKAIYTQLDERYECLNSLRAVIDKAEGR